MTPIDVRGDMLARLIAQAATEGGELVTLRAIVEEASEVGAARVLGRLGLSDPGAQNDIDESRPSVHEAFDGLLRQKPRFQFLMGLPQELTIGGRRTLGLG